MCIGCSRGYDLEFDSDCRRTFWVEAPLCLLKDLRFVPNDEMTLEEKMNAITRIVLIVFVIMLVMKYKHALTFLIIALIIIVLFYYAKRRALENEESDGRRGRSQRRMTSSDLDDYSPERVYVRAGNAREEALAYRDAYPERFEVTAGSRKDSEEDMKKKKNPRQPYPAVVPADMVVRSGNRREQELRREAEAHRHTYGKILNQDPAMNKFAARFQGGEKNYQPSRSRSTVESESNQSRLVSKNDEDFEARLEVERRRNLKKSFTGSPKVNYSKYHGYKTETFQDDVQETEDFHEGYTSRPRPEVRTEVEPVAVEPVAEKPARRRFLPSNYDASMYVEPEKNTTARLKSYSSGRSVRRPAQWSDSNTVEGKMDSSDIMYARAAKLEAQMKTRSRTDRNSHLNSIFAT